MTFSHEDPLLCIETRTICVRAGKLPGFVHPMAVKPRYSPVRASLMVIWGCSIAVGVFRAQTPDSASFATPEFDAASIKLWSPNPVSGGSRSGAGLPAPDGGHLQFTAGRVATPWTGVTARRIILEAYSANNYRVSGGSDWVDTDMFKLEARSADPSAPESELRLMLQMLLRKRFHLVLRHDRRELPVYALTVRKDKAKLREWTKAGDTDAARAALQAAFGSGATDASITTIPAYVDRMNSDRTNLLHGMPGIDRPVIDKTGLGGSYLIALQLRPEADYKDIVESQLGLKFVPEKANVDVLVIDYIEKPDPN